MANTVIVSTDGSELAIAAAVSGVSLLAPPEEFLVVAVVDAIDMSLAKDVSGMAGAVATEAELLAERKSLQADGEESLRLTADAIRDLVGDATIRTEVLEGSAGDVLCALAEQIDATAIVMGSRGRGGVRRALLGSVSDHVVRNATCPVVITGAGSD